MANALTVLEAGSALKTQGSLVNGLMPFFAGVASFFLQLQIQRATEFEVSVLLDPGASNTEESITDTLHLLVLQAVGLRNGYNDLALRQDSRLQGACLHGRCIVA